MITPRAVAVGGLGYGPLAFALDGFFAEEEIAEVVRSVAVTLTIGSQLATSLGYVATSAVGLTPISPSAKTLQTRSGAVVALAGQSAHSVAMAVPANTVVAPTIGPGPATKSLSIAGGIAKALATGSESEVGLGVETTMPVVLD